MFILNLSESPESQWFSTSHPTQDTITIYITFYIFTIHLTFPTWNFNPHHKHSKHTAVCLPVPLRHSVTLTHTHTLGDTEGPVPEPHNQVNHTILWFPVHMRVMLILYYYTVIQ